jgi:hypothetical protein
MSLNLSYRPFTGIVNFAIFVIIFSILLTASASAISKEDLKIPDPDMVQIITLIDGSKLMGQITSIGDKEIIFKTELGDMTISIDKIKELKEIPKKAIKDGGYWFENPNTTRLYFGPTGRMLERGKGYFSDVYIFFPGVSYGLTDNITIGGGMSLFPGVDMDDQIFYLTPKFGLKTSEKTSLAVGALIFALPEIDDESPTVGIAYGVGTYGDPDASITVGLGYGFVEDEVADKPMFIFGGEKRFARRLSFVTENWVFPGVDQPVISYGIRFFGEGLSVDLALFNVLDEDAIFPGVPYIDFVFNF